MSYKECLRPGKGAADILPLVREGVVFKHLIDDLAALFDGIAVDKVACIEGRGFILGAATAYRLGAGVVPLRHEEKLKSAVPVYSVTFTDYSGKQKMLEIQADAITAAERVVIIDDWVETAATMKAAIVLVERCGGAIVGIGVLMDDTTSAGKDYLNQYNYRFLERTVEGDAF
jgi:adenine phosphoribosyltransferase